MAPVKKKKKLSILRKIWICADVWMDILPNFDRPQLGLKMALLSPRFNALVNKHFDGKSELTIWREIRIGKMITTAKLFVEKSNGKTVQFPLPKYPLHNKIRFENLQIDYIDHSVITFLRSNQQIFDKGINLDLVVPLHDDVQPGKRIEQIKKFYFANKFSHFPQNSIVHFFATRKFRRFPNVISEPNDCCCSFSPISAEEMGQWSAEKCFFFFLTGDAIEK